MVVSLLHNGFLVTLTKARGWFKEGGVPIPMRGVHNATILLSCVQIKNKQKPPAQKKKIMILFYFF